MTGHSGAVTSLAFAPDGQQLLSGGADKSVRLWNVADGKQIRAFAGAADQVTSVAVSADGKRVAAAGLDKQARVWNLQSSAVEQTLTHPAAVQCLDLSTDGARLATGADDGPVRVWDLATGQLLQSLTGHQGAVNAVAFGGAMDVVISAGADKTLRRWPLAVTRVIVADQGKTNALAIVPGSDQVVTAGADKNVKLWDSAGKLVRTLTGLATPALRVAARPDGQQIAAGGDAQFASKDVFRWNAADGKPLAKLTAPAGVMGLAYSPDSEKLAVSGADKIVRIYGADDGALLEELYLPAPVSDIEFDANGLSLLLAGGDNNVYVAPLPLERVLSGHAGAVSCVALLPDGLHAVSGGADKTVRLWNLKTGAEERQFAGAAGPIHAVAVSSDGNKLAAAAADQKVHFWNIADAKPSPPLVLPAHPRSLAFAHANRWLVVGADDKLAHIFDLRLGAELETFPGHTAGVLAVASDAGGQRIVSGGADNTARLWNSSVRDATRAGKAPLTAAVFSPDGKCVYTAGEDKQLTAWLAESLAPGDDFSGAAAPLRALALSGDGKRLAAVGDDQLLRVWNTADAKLLAEVKTPAALMAAATDRSGDKYLVAGADNIVRNYALRSGEDGLELQLVQTGAGHTAPVRGLALADDGTTLFSVSTDRSLKTWFAASTAPRLTLRGHQAPVYSLAFDKTGRLLASASGDKTARLWDTDAGKHLTTCSGHTDEVLGVAFRSDGEQFASCGLDKTVRLWDLAGREAQSLGQGVTHGLTTLAYSPDGKYLTAGGLGKTLTTWDITKDEPLRAMSGHTNPIYRVRYNPAGSRLASVDYGGNLIIWNAANGDVLHHQQLPVQAAYSLCYSPDGKELAVATSDARVLLVTVPAFAQ